MPKCRLFNAFLGTAMPSCAPAFQVGDVVKATLDFWTYQASADLDKSRTPRPVIIAGIYQEKTGKHVGYDVVIQTTQACSLDVRPWRLDVDSTNLKNILSTRDGQICPRNMIATPKSGIISSHRVGRIDIKFMADIIARRALSLIAVREGAWQNFGLRFADIEARQGYFFSDDIIPDACHAKVQRKPMGGFLNQRLVDGIALWVKENALIEFPARGLPKVVIDWPPLGTFPEWPNFDQTLERLDALRAQNALRAQSQTQEVILSVVEQPAASTRPRLSLQR